MKIKHNLYYSFLFSILIISFILWNRLLRERLPRDLIPITVITRYFIITCILASIFLLITCYYILKTAKIIPRPNSVITVIMNNKYQTLLEKIWFKHLVNFIENHLINGIPQTYDFLYQYIYIKPFIQGIARLLSDYFFKHVLYLYIIFYVIPKIIPLCILLIEIILYHHINFFYISLYLLLIPLIFNAILYMIDHHATNSLDFYDHFFDFKIDNAGILNIYDKKLTNPSDIKIQQNYDTNHLSIDWGNLQCMYDITYRIRQQKIKYQNLFRSIYFFLLTISFILQVLILSGF